MGATSTSVESPFAIAVAKAIFQWRDDNNLPTDGNVDLPMRRCPRDDRYATIYPGDKLPEKPKSKRVLEVDADSHMNIQTPPHKKEKRELPVHARRGNSPEIQEESPQIQKMLLEFMAKMEYNNRITDQKIQALAAKFDEQEQTEEEEEEETSAEEEEDWCQPPSRPSQTLQPPLAVEINPDCQVQDEILDESFWASKDFEFEYESSDKNKGRIPLGKAWSSVRSVLYSMDKKEKTTFTRKDPSLEPTVPQLETLQTESNGSKQASSSSVASFLATPRLEFIARALKSSHCNSEMGLALRTMSTHRAALADPLFYGFQIDTNQKLFRDFFMACRTRRPIKKCLPPLWEVDKILLLLKTPQFSDNRTISLPALLLKTLFLAGLASGSCVSEIAAWRRDAEHCVFLPQDKGVSLSTREGKDARLHKLCPVKALSAWISRTAQWENPHNFLWFNAASKKPANIRMLALRFKQLIQLAYQDKVQANFHQLRKVATSLAFDKGVSLAQICSRANWAGDSVFFKSYFLNHKSETQCIVLGKKINKKKK
ncbi:unnamed protein product [Rotaria magnacalcarata]|uniref:Tyr recombinase domain-containing protein n=1 Tax=Rotaria magnacalcarata TaxID=392030 RepID=A0A820CCP9_9BILA|nr:unnamed protein product [Rotaria magnacalcarata]